MIEMKVAGIALDAATRNPIVLLRDSTERRALPIYICLLYTSDAADD